MPTAQTLKPEQICEIRDCLREARDSILNAVEYQTCGEDWHRTIRVALGAIGRAYDILYQPGPIQ